MMRWVLLPMMFWLGSAAAADDLLTVYEQARAQATDPAIAESAVGAADARFRQARGALLPRISGSASRGKQKQEQRFEGAPEGGLGFGSGDDGDDDFEDQQSLSVSLEQPLFDWGAWQSRAAADERRQAARADLGAAEQALITTVTRRYFDILAAEDALAAAERQLEVIGRQLDRAEAEFEAGIRAITDQQEAASQRDAARVDRLNARNSLMRSRAALAELTGRMPESIQPLPVPEAPAEPEGSASQWVARGLANSPEVRSARLALAAAERDIRQARGGHYPQVNLVGRIGETEQTVNFPIPGAGNTEFESVTETQSVAVELSLPIFSGGSASAAVAEAEYERERVRQQWIARRRTVELEVRTAYGDMQTAAARIKALNTAISSAETAIEAARAGQQTGTRNVLDVLEAEIEAVDRGVQRRQAVYDYYSAAFALRQAAGLLSRDDLIALNNQLKP